MRESGAKPNVKLHIIVKLKRRWASQAQPNLRPLLELTKDSWKMKATLILLSSICFWYLAHKYWLSTQKQQGHIVSQPSSSDSDLAWRGQAGIALIGAISAISNFINPSTPPFTGKWSTIYSVIFDALGPHGRGFLWALISASFAMSAWKNYKQKARASRGQE